MASLQLASAAFDSLALSLAPRSVFCGTGPGSYIGCIDIPDAVILAGGAIGLSSVDRSRSQAECADGDHYARLGKVRSFIREHVR